MKDSYKTIAANHLGTYKEKGSKFIKYDKRCIDTKSCLPISVHIMLIDFLQK